MSTDFITQKIKTDSLRVAYIEKGNGEACLFLHGNRDCKDGFSSLFKNMNSDFRLIALDIRGHGETDKPYTGYNFDQLIIDILSFLKAKDITIVNLIGHSLGGVLSMLLALQVPELINKLVLMGTSASFKPKFKRPEIGELITKEKIHETNIHAAPFFFLPEYNEVRDEVLNNWSNIPPFVHQELIKMGHPDLREQIGQITKPTLLIYGEKDVICPPENGNFLYEQIKNASLKIIKGTGHFMFMENPQEVSEAILSFLKEK